MKSFFLLLLVLMVCSSCIKQEPLLSALDKIYTFSDLTAMDKNHVLEHYANAMTIDSVQYAYEYNFTIPRYKDTIVFAKTKVLLTYKKFVTDSSVVYLPTTVRTTGSCNTEKTKLDIWPSYLLVTNAGSFQSLHFTYDFSQKSTEIAYSSSADGHSSSMAVSNGAGFMDMATIDALTTNNQLEVSVSGEKEEYSTHILASVFDTYRDVSRTIILKKLD